MALVKEFRERGVLNDFIKMEDEPEPYEFEWGIAIPISILTTLHSKFIYSIITGWMGESIPW